MLTCHSQETVDYLEIGLKSYTTDSGKQWFVCFLNVSNSVDLTQHRNRSPNITTTNPLNFEQLTSMKYFASQLKCMSANPGVQLNKLISEILHVFLKNQSDHLKGVFSLPCYMPFYRHYLPICNRYSTNIGKRTLCIKTDGRFFSRACSNLISNEFG